MKTSTSKTREISKIIFRINNDIYEALFVGDKKLLSVYDNPTRSYWGHNAGITTIALLYCKIIVTKIYNIDLNIYIIDSGLYTIGDSVNRPWDINTTTTIENFIKYNINN